MYSIPQLNGSVILIGANTGILTQKLLDTVGPARTFDIYGFSGFTQERNKTLLAIGKLVTEFAQLCNFTPVIGQLTNPKSIDKLYNEGSIGMIIPYVVPAVISPHFTPMVKTRASLALSVYQYFNFVYCDQSNDVIGTDLTVIGKPFDLNLWLALLLSCVLMTAAGSLVITKNVSNMALISIAALFSQTSATNCRRHVLLSIWLVSCSILNNMYSGSVTSELVAPVGEDVIKTVDDLVNRKYRLLYTTRLNYTIKMVGKMAGSRKATMSLRFLLQSLKILPNNTPMFIEKLAFEPHVAFFAPYMATMTYWRMLTQKIKQAYGKTKEVKFKRRCYLGHELTSTYSVPEVWIFRMKNPELSSDLAHTFNRIYSAGIHDYWMKVFFRLQVARRAQDVNMFKSKTQVVVDDLVEPLSLYKGNTVGPARTFDIYGFSGFTQERNNTLLAIGKLLTEFAQLCNFTPVIGQLSDPSSLDQLYNDDKNLGMIIPFVVPAVVSSHFAPMVKTNASLVLSCFKYFNFVYCSQSKDVVGIDLTVIIKPFDIYLWLALILCSVLITATGSLTITKNVTRMALISVAALFSQNAARKRNRHLLISLWLVTCLIINNMYSGEVSSELVAPVEQDIIKTVDDLASRKYRLVYHSQSNYVINMIKKMTGSHKSTSSLSILLQSIVVFPNKSSQIEKLAFDSHVAVFTPYIATMTYWRTLTQTIKQAYERKKEVKFKRRCYLGRDLTSTYSIPEVWIFRMKNPKLSSDLAHAFTRMESAGINDYWTKVSYRLQVAQRAQDVNIFKSKTQAKVDDLVEPLSLYTGNTLVIFVVFFICVTICVVAFCMEMLVQLF
ncbi:unnamed protein product [Orchesella dallaii]|uniref:Uncharacterized protein n=1 Tax=Orchesella dallaii TaxID=48710 RepID=A0ABP1Q9C8_9HEXA